MVEITFIGGPMDLKRLTLPDDTPPPYYRFATPPPFGPLYERPARPEVVALTPTFDYEIAKLYLGGRTVYVGYPMEIREVETP